MLKAPPASNVTPSLDVLRRIQLIAVDIDGTLTDGKLHDGGKELGWTQTYHVRDGESIKRAVAGGIPVVPISRNKTACAKKRMAGLDLPTQWVGVSDKLRALDEVVAKYEIAADHIAYVGDGPEDSPILKRTIGFAVADAHELAIEAAFHITKQPGGNKAVEEVIDLILVATGRDRVTGMLVAPRESV